MGAVSHSVKKRRRLDGIEPQTDREGGEVVAHRGAKRLEELIAAVALPGGIAEDPGERDVAVVALEQIDGGIEDGFALVDRLGARVHAGVGQVIRNGVESKALFSHANPKIVIEGAVDIGIEGAAPIGRGTHEGGRLADEAVAFEHDGIPGEGRVAADGLAGLVDPPAFSVDHVDAPGGHSGRRQRYGRRREETCRRRSARRRSRRGPGESRGGRRRKDLCPCR